MSTPSRKRPRSPLASYWTWAQQTVQVDLVSGAAENPYVQRKQRLPRDVSLRSRCDTLIDGGYRGSTLSFRADQRRRVWEFAQCDSSGELSYRGLRCVFREL